MHRNPSSTRHALTLMETMIALVILAIVSMLFLRTTSAALRDSATATDWQLEAVAVEKAIERLRLRDDPATVRALDQTSTDASGSLPVTVHVRGSAPSSSACPGLSCDGLVQLDVSARRPSMRDSVAVSVLLFLRKP